MKNNIKYIKFDRRKHPGVEFDLAPLEFLLNRKDLDHSPFHQHRVEFYILILITAGKGVHTIDFTDFEYRRGTVLAIRKDQVHQFHPSDATGFMLLFTEEFVLSYLEKSGAEKIMEFFNELIHSQKTDLQATEFNEFMILVNEIVTEFHRAHDEYTPGIIRNLLQVIVSKLHRKRTDHPEFQKDQKHMSSFLKLQKLVEAQCTEFRSVQYYADQLGVTTKTLNNITQRIIGKAPKTFIDELATLQIKRMLINSSLSVKEIAYEAGFDEPTNLFKFFKRYTGQTPEAFRSRYIRK